VPLQTAVDSSSTVLKDGVVDTIIRESPFLEMLPFTRIKGDALRHRMETDLPSPQFRAVGGTYTRSYGTDTPHFWGVAIAGSEVFVDNYEVRVLGDVEDVKAKQFRKHAKANAIFFDVNFIDGDGTGNSFKGLNTLAAEGWGQELAIATNGGPLTLDFLDQSIDLMRGIFMADGIFCNRTLRRKITNLGRNVAGQFSLIDVGFDVFGRQVSYYDGKPIRIVGDNLTGGKILEFDETQGASSVCSSIYFIGMDADGVTGLAGANGSMEVTDFGETEAAPGHLGRIEWYPGVAVFNPYALVRLKGITNA
jgi:hypothetical protein